MIKGFFQISHIRNTGAIWGILSNHPNIAVSKVITALSIIALVVMIYFFLKIEPKCKLELISISFIIGGAVGNIADRILKGYVIDFFDFYVKNLHWPTFNVADLFITIGVILLAISIWRGECPLIKK